MSTIEKPQLALAEAHGKLIRKTSGVCGGAACLRDTRIMVWLLVDLRRQGAVRVNDFETILHYFFYPLFNPPLGGLIHTVSGTAFGFGSPWTKRSGWAA
jgi:uncharacterized protein (DUF433 family)